MAALRAMGVVKSKFANLLGYAAAADGGGGAFFWSPADTRTDDGGTIIAVAGVATGRWNRIMSGPVYNVRWFGAKGDGATDDTAAIQNAILSAYANQVTAVLLGYSVFSLPAIYFPAGNYHVTTELQADYYIRLFSDQQAVISTSSTTNNILRAGPPQFICEGITFSGGRHAVIFGGLGSAGIWGSAFLLGSYTNGGFSRFQGCQFLNQAGAAIMTDTTQAAQQRTVSSQLTIEECFAQTPAFFWGAWDQVNIKKCWFGANDSQVSAPVDSGGRTVAFITSGDRLVIEDSNATPQYATATNPVWLRAAGQARMDGCSWGGEGTMTIAETFYSTTISYNGSAIFVDPTAVPQLEVRGGTMSSAINIPWLNCRDTFPNKILVNKVFSGTTGVIGTPPPMQDFYASKGIWLNSAINLVALQSRPNLVVKICDSPIGAGAFRFFQSSAPGVFGVDVSSVIRKHLAAGNEGPHAAGHSYPGEGSRQENNSWFAGVVNIIDSTTNGFNSSATGAGNTGATETISGLALHIIKATADNGFYNAISKTGWNPGAAFAGNWVFCFEIVGANTGGEVLVGINTVSATPQADHSRMYSAMPNGIQRFWVPFRYDGAAALYFSLQFVSLSHFLADGSTQSAFSCGAFMVNPGDTPALWKQPVNSIATPTLNITTTQKVQVYRGTTAPPSTGVYAAGDQFWNIAATAGQTKAWVCIQASPLLWDPIGEGAGQVRTVVAASDTATATDVVILVNRAGAVAATLPPNVMGKHVVYKDISGNASTNHITLLPASGLIDGAATIVMNQNYEALELRADGTNWWVC